MATQIIKVDFKAKQIIDSECVPAITRWSCDCCGKNYVNLEGSDTNTKQIQLVKQLKNQKEIVFSVCETCCNVIGNVFKSEENIDA